MRGALVGSATVHVLLFVGLIVAQSRAPRLEVGPEVIQLALLEASQTPKPAPAPAPAPPAETQAPDLVREPGTGVKIAPVKPKPKPKPETPPAPEKPPAPPMALPPAPMGGAGLQGDVAVDAGNFEFSYYLLLLRNRIAQNWTPPAGLVGGGQPIRAVVYFRVDRSGGLRDVRLETPSAAEFFDRSALRAVVLSDPMPPLPAGYTGDALGVHFGFGYTAP